MLNEISLFQMQENEGFGTFLIETIAQVYGCDADPDLISKMVYKYTDCGAWIKFDEQGILVGTIVEGDDAEFSKRIDLTSIYPDDENSASLLINRFHEALQECENFALEHWGQWKWVE